MISGRNNARMEFIQRWMGLLMVILCTFSLHVSGQCVVEDVYYQDGTVWKPDTCTVCSCHSPVPVCEKIQCKSQKCDFLNGDYLRLLPNKCCPECASRAEPCSYKQHVIPHNTEWHPRPCETCYCDNSDVYCYNHTCPQLRCRPGEVHQHLPGQCCPQCTPSGRSCHHQEEEHVDGSEWSPMPCVKCVCRNGHSTCLAAQCPPLACPMQLEFVSGECCPRCTRSVCRENHHVYQNGDVWLRSKCTHCICRDGYAVCKKQECNPTSLQCNTDEQRVEKDGCCPVCVRKTGSCSHNEKIYYHGDIWNTTHCEFCLCQDSDVHCSAIQCEKAKCRNGEVLLTSENECCPRCMQQAKCVHQEKMYKNGESWQSAPCEMCECDQGKTTCYIQTCPTCPKGSTRVNLPLQCCGLCKPVECAVDCAECDPRNPDHCTRCEDASLALQDGRCVRQCLMGYFQTAAKVCKACHPSCAQCRGETELHCISCKHNMLLKAGSCVEHCGSGFYEYLGICQACHETCGECTGPKRIECLKCARPWSLLKNNKCVDKCGHGFYPKDDMCVGCDRTECPSCGKNCPRCPAGLVTRGSRCYHQCDREYYPKDGICEDCPMKCLVCNADQVCLQCNSKSFMISGRCVSTCDTGYYGNPETRLCEPNAHAPDLYSNNSIISRTGMLTEVTTNMLQAFDVDSPVDRLLFHVIKLPTNGRLLKIGQIEDRYIEAGEFITAVEIAEGRIRFEHNQSTVLIGDMELYASDGQLESYGQMLLITVISDQPPVLVHKLPLFVGQGGEGHISAEANLDFSDADSEMAIVITVLYGPDHGILSRHDSDQPINMFTLDDLRREGLIYKHNGGLAQQDHLLLQVSDGFNLMNLPFVINIRTQEDKVPVLLHNEPAFVEPGQMTRISNEMLEAEALDGGKSELVYTLTPPAENPKDGEVMMVVPMPKAGPAEGWQEVGEGQMGSKMFRFLQRDIDEGRIFYKHNGAENSQDFFRFEVSENGDADETLREQEFNVVVMQPHLEAPPSDSFGSVPSVAPGVRLGMTVMENQASPITNTHLAFTDLDSRDTDLVYTITSPLKMEEGTVENVDKPFEAITEFTQADINANRILYRPPLKEIGQMKKEFCFRFKVKDRNSGHELAEHKFTIYVLPVNNMPPRLTTPNPSVAVTIGGTVPIGTSVLAVTDPDTSVDELMFCLRQAPFAGQLVKKVGGVKVMLRDRDRFTYSELSGNSFFYTHDGSNVAEDEIQLCIDDGAHTVPIILKIRVLLADKNAPLRQATTEFCIEVTEGQAAYLQRNALAFKDIESEDGEIRLVLAAAPQYGRIGKEGDEHFLGVTDSFTQEDINNGGIKYTAEDEVGMRVITDTFYFNVTNPRNRVLPMQPVTVEIKPKNNQPPMVTVGTGLLIEEGGRVPLTLDDISATDLDTPVERLAVIVEVAPKFGVFENIRPVPGPGGEQRRRIVTSFTMHDLIDAMIHYVQSDHKNKEPTSDAFLFHVTDGVNKSPSFRFNITIELKNDEVPALSAEQIFCDGNGAVTIHSGFIFVVDHDTRAEDLVFTVEQPPRYGNLRLKKFKEDPPIQSQILELNDIFTYEDVLGNLLVYTHSGPEIPRDQFTLLLTDGQFTERNLFSVIIGVVSDETPRIEVNKGAKVRAGSQVVITSGDLRATDVDSDDNQLLFILTQGPDVGRLQLVHGSDVRDLVPRSAFSSFRQQDIFDGRVRFLHPPTSNAGFTFFKFTVADPEGHRLLNQSFIITIIEDYLPPEVVNNRDLTVKEGQRARITAHFLSATDADSEPADLDFQILEAPRYGHLSVTWDPEVPILNFTMSDISNGNVIYTHLSDEEIYIDTFKFSVTDGSNEVIDTFKITITPVDDCLPLVTFSGFRVNEGGIKPLTEFELKAVDDDTKDDQIQFEIVDYPRHGAIEVDIGDSKQRRGRMFTMADIRAGKVQYRHVRSSHSPTDHFTFTVSDGTNGLFVVVKNGQEVTTKDPQRVDIEINIVDNGNPFIHTNIGLHYLEIVNGQATNFITSRELLAKDLDTPPNAIIYHIRQRPSQGYIEKTSRPRTPATHFTQDDINKGLIRYVLKNNISAVKDYFTFDIRDRKPNYLRNNQFHISWSYVEFEQPVFNMTEKGGIIRVPIKRYGHLRQYSVVRCESQPGSATTERREGSPGHRDFTPKTQQIKFDEWQDTKTCNIAINDDSIFEGPETFQVVLVQPSFTLLGDLNKADVNIYDLEDEPMIEFEKSVYTVQEGDGFLSATLVRTGDITMSVSAICYSKPITARGTNSSRPVPGADYRNRIQVEENRVLFPAGVSRATCDVMIFDDADDENAEEFEVALCSPSVDTRIGPKYKAKVIIDGPNDASCISLSEATYFVDESAGHIDIPVHRSGKEVSHTSTVWCATRMTNPPSAKPDEDYIPVSSQITFKPGQTTQWCRVSIVDDASDPKMEGSENFIVFLSSPTGSSLSQPYSAHIIINDSSTDVPVIQFNRVAHIVRESRKYAHIPIIRVGDINSEVSVICHTKPGTAKPHQDYQARHASESSRVVFQPGQRAKNCTVSLVDDSTLEPYEYFFLKLTSPVGPDDSEATIGTRDTANVTICDDYDVPCIEFEQTGYSVYEPSSPDERATVVVRVVRLGAMNGTVQVQCGTKGGSAIPDIDYRHKQQLLTFRPGVSHIDFSVEILYNADSEWHETFCVVLGPQSPQNGRIGSIDRTTVTILDRQVSGTCVLPAPPLVVSLMDYNDVEQGNKHDPTPGYPLVCVTPCDPAYPRYSVTGPMCDTAGINATAIQYRWEVAMPVDMDGMRAPFEQLTTGTIFTSVTGKVLDSIYFRPKFRIRCRAQPLHKSGNMGVPTRSDSVSIGIYNGICHSPVTAGKPHGYSARSFTSTLKYVGPDDRDHPNTVHISIRIPHQDGLLPLISTMPIHNFRLLLSEPVYRQHHACSNFILPQERRGSTRFGFLNPRTIHTSASSHSKPHQFDPALRGDRTVQLYTHLNLRTCSWHFDSWFHMTELVDFCGGDVISDFEIRDVAKSYLTVRVPLYVTYLYARAPSGWSSLGHTTQMEFSFFYNTYQWKSGLDTGGKLSGRLQVLKIIIGKTGNLVMDFKTQAKFKGHFVINHEDLPGVTGKLTPPRGSPLSFELTLMWGQPSFDAPTQIWRATSDFSLKDYTGEYTLELIPCTVASGQRYTDPAEAIKICKPHQLQKFIIPIAFQQTNRPVPVEYSLDTNFQLTSKKESLKSTSLEEIAETEDETEDKIFTPGETIYGVVSWNPSQDLQTAYRLQIQKVFICTGKDGYIPTFDPKGDVYREGPQFGCLQRTPKLKHRFLLLDRGDPDVINRNFNGADFDARFISETPEYNDADTLTGVDGFTLKVDPLYMADSTQQWYMQVMYVIGPADKLLERYQRSITVPLKSNRKRRKAGDPPDRPKNGTNIYMLKLNHTALSERHLLANSQSYSDVLPLVVGVFGLLAFLVVVICTIFFVRKRRSVKKKEKNVHNTLPFNTKIEPRVTASVEEQDDTWLELRKNYRCTTGNLGNQKLADLSLDLDGYPKSPTLRVKTRKIRAHRNRWSRPKSGTEV